MPYPVKNCAICGEKFELKPDKPGFANRCPDCTEAEADANRTKQNQPKATREQNAARRDAMRNLLYRKDS